MSDIVSSILLNTDCYFFILCVSLIMAVSHTYLGNSLILLGVRLKFVW